MHQSTVEVTGFSTMRIRVLIASVVGLSYSTITETLEQVSGLRKLSVPSIPVGGDANSDGGSLPCDKDYYAQWLVDEKYNYRKMKQDCIARITKDLLVLHFGPPPRSLMKKTMCNGACREWDEKMRNAVTRSGCPCDDVHPLGTSWPCFETRNALLCDMLGVCGNTDEQFDGTGMCKSNGRKLSIGILQSSLSVIVILYLL